jgi:hypothetical protein
MLPDVRRMHRRMHQMHRHRRTCMHRRMHRPTTCIHRRPVRSLHRQCPAYSGAACRAYATRACPTSSGGACPDDADGGSGPPTRGHAPAPPLHARTVDTVQPDLQMHAPQTDAVVPASPRRVAEPDAAGTGWPVSPTAAPAAAADASTTAMQTLHTLLQREVGAAGAPAAPPNGHAAGSTAIPNHGPAGHGSLKGRFFGRACVMCQGL